MKWYFTGNFETSPWYNIDTENQYPTLTPNQFSSFMVKPKVKKPKQKQKKP
jgi:hypothetical protein